MAVPERCFRAHAIIPTNPSFQRVAHAVGVAQADIVADAVEMGSMVFNGTVGTRVGMSMVVDETADAGRLLKEVVVHAVAVGRYLGATVSAAASTIILP